MKNRSNKNNEGEKHRFAFFIQKVSKVIIQEECFISDLPLLHRLTHVLRLKVGDEIMLFDREAYVVAAITLIAKKKLRATLLEYKKNTYLKPELHLLLPVLKKDALSDAVYSAVEVGASTIQLVYTDKSQRTLSSHELDRLERVAISAAEQSKRFAFPEIKETIPFMDAIDSCSTSMCIFFDPRGITVQEQLEAYRHGSQQSITLLMGPEGDLSLQEKKLLKQAGWSFCALTPTVLRAVQAVAVGLGVFRSLLK